MKIIGFSVLSILFLAFFPVGASAESGPELPEGHESWVSAAPSITCNGVTVISKKPEELDGQEDTRALKSLLVEDVPKMHVSSVDGEAVVASVLVGDSWTVYKKMEISLDSIVNTNWTYQKQLAGIDRATYNQCVKALQALK